jgi:hypothetical protein
MSEHHSASPQDLHAASTHSSESAGHEPDAINTRIVFIVGGVIGSVVVASFIFLAWLWLRLQPASDSEGGVPTAWRRAGQPAVNFDQPAELRAVRADEARRIKEYSWLSTDKTRARIPVDRAMQILLERGFPTAEPPASPDSESAPEEAPASETESLPAAASSTEQETAPQPKPATEADSPPSAAVDDSAAAPEASEPAKNADEGEPSGAAGENRSSDAPEGANAVAADDPDDAPEGSGVANANQQDSNE